MVRGVTVLCVVGLFSFAGCKKQPSPAQLAAATFAERVLKDRQGAADTTVLGTGPVINVKEGAPEEGTYSACGEAQGRLEWVRTRPGAQQQLPNGDVVTETAVDICMATEQGTCNRPNSYSFKAIMRNEGGAWKVAGSTCAATNIVR